MGESPQSSPVDTRNKPPTPPRLPQFVEEPGTDLGAFFLSFLLWQRLDAKSNGGAQEITAPAAHSGRIASASAAAAVVSPRLVRGSSWT